MNNPNIENSEDFQDVEVLGEDQVKVSGGFNPSYRFSDGKIVTGSEENGTLEQKKLLTGLLKSITIRTWMPDDSSKKASQHLRFTLTTKEGDVDVEEWLSDMEGNLDKANGKVISIAWGLLQCAKGEQIAVQAQQGATANKWGKKPTFINFFRVVDTKGNTKEVPRRGKTDKAIEVIWADFKAQLMQHPAWIAPTDPKNQVRPDTHLHNLIALCAKNGWVTPQDAPRAWIESAAAVFQRNAADINGLRDISDDDWGTILQAVQDRDPGNPPKAGKKVQAASALD